ncbi:MAG TPA: N-acetylmuramoyl-L-alanine amidase [Terriglobales bacterium]|nr:N-acetylmuramoyl-L-alanine amidase [Terriglobales bacterium]
MMNVSTHGIGFWVAGTILALTFPFSALFVSGFSRNEQHISIYSTVANYSLAVTDRNGQEYVGLLEILDPLGKVRAKGKHESWKVRYNDVESEFTANKTRVRVHGNDFDLPAPFLLEGNRGLVPLSSLSLLLPRILGGPVTFHEASRRLFIGTVGVRFATQINKTIPPSLVINFSSPVNPVVATEPGRLRMTFTREPLLSSDSPNLNFDNKIIPSAIYQEQDGTAEITVNGSSPLFATFSNDGRTITIAPAPRAPTPTTQNTPSSSAMPAAFSALTNSSTKRYFAVIDAAHGGEDRGAILSPQLAEKDINLIFARRLQQELESRGMPALLLRNEDTNLPEDKRANVANSLHPAIYICLHATAQGTSIGLYSALLPSGEEIRGPFLPWNQAQSPYLVSSRNAIKILTTEFQANHVASHNFSASLKPLNNISVPAIAIELAPPQDGVPGFNSVEYQQLITASMAMGLSEARTSLEAVH